MGGGEAEAGAEVGEGYRGVANENDRFTPRRKHPVAALAFTGGVRGAKTDSCT